MKRKNVLNEAGVLLIALVMMLSAVVATVTANCPDCCPGGIISYWRAENNADDCMDLNHGTLKNGATFATGKLNVGHAFSFDGIDDWVDTPGTSCNFGTGDFTLMAWIQYNGGTSTYFPTIMSKRTYGTDTNGGYSLFLNYGTGTGGLMLRIFDMNYMIPGGSDVGDGNWHHVAATRTGTTLTFYVDGIQNPLGGTVNCNKNTDSTANLRIGLDSSSSYSTQWEGLLDEIAVYHRALSGGEIQCVYDASVAGNDYCCGQTKVEILKGLSVGNGDLITERITNIGCIYLHPVQWQISYSVIFPGSGGESGGGNDGLPVGGHLDEYEQVNPLYTSSFHIIFIEATASCCDTIAHGIAVTFGGKVYTLFTW